MDLVRFYQDLPKYYQYLSPASHEHWEQFQSENADSIHNKRDLNWEMPVLVSAAILSSKTPRTVDEISSETMRILAKETAVPKPVCVIVSVCFVCIYVY